MAVELSSPVIRSRAPPYMDLGCALVLTVVALGLCVRNDLASLHALGSKQ